MAELIVVRHGETDWNLVRRLQGQTDVALNATGIEQAARLAAALAEEDIGAIHSSDLGRALATAEPIAVALGKPIRRHASLRERHYGALEGRTYAEILAELPGGARLSAPRDVTHVSHDGESRATFYRRAVAAVADIAREADDRREPASLLIVTHGGVLDMLHRAAFDTAVDADRRCPIPNAAINRLRFRDGRFEVLAWAVPT